MAAVQLAPGRAFDGQRLYQHARAWLPAYAVPHFVRVQVSGAARAGEVRAAGGTGGLTVPALQDTLEVTGTFKLVKSRLVREGFDVGAIADSLFVLDNQARAFRPLTQETYRAVCEGTWKL